MRPIVLVQWDDAFIDTDDFNEKQAARTQPCRRTTVGFLICTTEDGLVLATDFYDNSKNVYNARMFLPHGMITGYYELELDRPIKPRGKKDD
jgi:hypothetical protein